MSKFTLAFGVLLSANPFVKAFSATDGKWKVRDGEICLKQIDPISFERFEYFRVRRFSPISWAAKTDKGRRVCPISMDGDLIELALNSGHDLLLLGHRALLGDAFAHRGTVDEPGSFCTTKLKTSVATHLPRPRLRPR